VKKTERKKPVAVVQGKGKAGGVLVIWRDTRGSLCTGNYGQEEIAPTGNTARSAAIVQSRNRGDEIKSVCSREFGEE